MVGSWLGRRPLSHHLEPGQALDIHLEYIILVLLTAFAASKDQELPIGQHCAGVTSPSGGSLALLTCDAQL